MSIRGKRPRALLVDLPRVRRALAELDRLADEHPGLTGPSSAENRAGWEAVLQEDEMVAAKMVAFRLHKELIERLDAYAERMAAQTGITVTRSDVAKKLITEGLARAESEGKKRKR